MLTCHKREVYITIKAQSVSESSLFGMRKNSNEVVIFWFEAVAGSFSWEWFRMAWDLFWLPM